MNKFFAQPVKYSNLARFDGKEAINIGRCSKALKNHKVRWATFVSLKRHYLAEQINLLQANTNKSTSEEQINLLQANTNKSTSEKQQKTLPISRFTYQT